MISENLKNNLQEKSRIENDLCVGFKHRQMSAITRLISPVISIVKNRSKEQYISVSGEKLYIFYAKGFFTADVVDESTLQVVKFESINSVNKKDVDFNGVRSLQFTINHSSGSVSGIIDSIEDRKIFNDIVAKIGK